MRIAKQLSVVSLVVFFLIPLAAPAFSYDLVIPDTGQELCYDWEHIMCDEWHMVEFDQICDTPPYCPEEGEDFYGQDATYTINPPDLTDNEDGTVTDNLTELMWEQKNEVNDLLLYNYDDAIAYCDDLVLGGYDDWRAPTRKEYSTVLNLGRTSPALDTTYFPSYNPPDILYWTTSDYADDPTQKWIMQISFGTIEPWAMVDACDTQPYCLYKIRCVRGAAEPVASYTDNSNGTVTDNITGLMWEQKTDDDSSRDKDVTHTWLEALNYCEDLVLGNYSDWKLPTPKELERMVDTSTSSPAVDTTYFPNTNSDLYWTGSTCTGCHKFVNGVVWIIRKLMHHGIPHTLKLVGNQTAVDHEKHPDWVITGRAGIVI